MNNWLSLSFLALIMVTITSCKTSKDVTKLAEDEVIFYLRKGGCFGQCPTYNLSISENGYATYIGGLYSKKEGKFGKQLPKDGYKKLVKTFAKVDFAAYPEKFESQIMDLPLIVIGHNDGGGYKTVAGRENRPEDLMQLQFLLEKVADSGGWILLESAEVIAKSKKPEPIVIYEEIIIETMPGTLMAKWMESMDKYGVRLKNVLAPDRDLYLITYSHDTIEAEEFLKMLKADKDIKSAEFNIKTTRRGR